MVYRPREPMENLAYLELVRQAAMRVLLPEETVRLVLEALLDTMQDALLGRKRIILRKFGSLRVMLRSSSKLGNYAAVVFRASGELKNVIRKELVDERKQGRGHVEVRGPD